MSSDSTHQKNKIRLWWSSVNQAIKNNKSFNRSPKFKYNNKLTFSLDHCFILKIANIALYLSVTAFRGKYLFRTLFLCLWLHEDETSIYTLSSKPHKGLAICRAKAVSSFLSHFKTLSIGLVPRVVEPRTFSTSVKCCINWASSVSTVLIFHLHQITILIHSFNSITVKLWQQNLST